MRLLACLTAGLTLLQYAAAAANATEAPACGLTCIATLVLSSGCSFTNTTCICPNVPLNDDITACVKANCTIREQLQTKKYSADFCGVKGEDRRSLVWIIAVVFGLLGLAAFGLRCFARLYVVAQSWGADDYVMCLAVAVMIPLSVIAIPLSQHGLGLDMWNVSFDDITAVLYLYYFDEIIYITALSLTKISILLFYLKVFPGQTFRYCVYVLIVLNTIYFLAFDFLLVFQCKPIRGAWLTWDGEIEAKCISINILGWSAAAINIVLDLAVIILPLPELFRLSLSLKKRIQVMLMFAVGIFVTCVSVVRLHSLIEFGNTENVTQDYVEVGYWSTIEVPVGVICACMPAIRSLFSLFFPKVFGTSRAGGSSYGLGSLGASSRLSSRQRLASNAMRSQRSQRSQIQVKQEWTVVSDPYHPGSHVRYASQAELVTLDSDSDSPPRKVTLVRKTSGYGQGAQQAGAGEAGFAGLQSPYQGRRNNSPV